MKSDSCILSDSFCWTEYTKNYFIFILMISRTLLEKERIFIIAYVVCEELNIEIKSLRYKALMKYCKSKSQIHFFKEKGEIFG